MSGFEFWMMSYYIILLRITFTLTDDAFRWFWVWMTGRMLETVMLFYTLIYLLMHRTNINITFEVSKRESMQTLQNISAILCAFERIPYVIRIHQTSLNSFVLATRSLWIVYNERFNFWQRNFCSIHRRCECEFDAHSHTSALHASAKVSVFSIKLNGKFLIRQTV